MKRAVEPGSAYRIAEELSAAHGCIEMLKRGRADAVIAEAECHQANLRALCGQLLTGVAGVDPMHVARVLAAACCIDDALKPPHPCYAQAEASARAERLHDFARALAGPRAADIYGDDEGLDEVRDWQRARIAGKPVEPEEVFSPHTLVIDDRAAA